MCGSGMRAPQVFCDYPISTVTCVSDGTKNTLLFFRHFLCRERSHAAGDQSVYGELQAWRDKQTSAAIRMRGTIILANLARLASNPHDMDLLRMTRQNVAGLEEAAALMRRRCTTLSRSVPAARTERW
jgi:hypothetical protein